MPTVICKLPVTYNGKRYKPGDAFYAEDKYIDEVSKCCDCVERQNDQKIEQVSGKRNRKRAPK